MVLSASNLSEWLNNILPMDPDDDFEYHLRLTRREFGIATDALQSKCSHIFSNNSPNRQTTVAKQLAMY